MKEWYYIASDKPNEKNYFDSYDDTQFAILCIFRFKAPINEVPDYAVYHNGKFDIRFCYNTIGVYLPIWWDTMIAAQMIDENEQAKLKIQYKNHVDPTIGSYNIEKLFTGLPYAWIDPEIFALYAAIDAYDTYKLQQIQEEYFKQEHDLDKLTTYHDSVVNAEIDIEMGEIISFIEAYEGEMDEDGEFKKNIDKIKFW